MKIILSSLVVCGLFQAGCNKRTEISEPQSEVPQSKGNPFEGIWEFRGANHPWYSDLTIYGYSGLLHVDGHNLSVTFTKTGRFDEYYGALIPVSPEDREKDSVTYEGTITKYHIKDGDLIEGDLSIEEKAKDLADQFGDIFYSVSGLPFEENVQIQISQENSGILLLGSQDPPWVFAEQPNINKKANKAEISTPMKPSD